MYVYINIKVAKMKTETRRNLAVLLAMLQHRVYVRVVSISPCMVICSWQLLLYMH